MLIKRTNKMFFLFRRFLIGNPVLSVLSLTDKCPPLFVNWRAHIIEFTQNFVKEYLSSNVERHGTCARENIHYSDCGQKKVKFERKANRQKFSVPKLLCFYFLWAFFRNILQSKIRGLKYDLTFFFHNYFLSIC